MARIFGIASLVLAAVSAVSGHVIRHRGAPPGWETNILQEYNDYHHRYLKWKCQDQHNTTFFDKCCHPLLKGEPVSVLENLGCKAPDEECDDGGSSAPPSSTPSSSSQHTQANASPEAPTPTPSQPKSGALGKINNDSPSSQPTTPTPLPTTQSPTSSAPPAQTSSSGSNGAEVHEGQATFYAQNGVAGACGTVHKETDLICALDSRLYKKGLCGKKVHVRNTKNGHTVVVTVEDECPTCVNANHIDFSTGAYDILGSENDGVLPIEWYFVD